MRGTFLEACFLGVAEELLALARTATYIPHPTTLSPITMNIMGDIMAGEIKP
jgi:hypothetical protein